MIVSVSIGEDLSVSEVSLGRSAMCQGTSCNTSLLHFISLYPHTFIYKQVLSITIIKQSSSNNPSSINPHLVPDPKMVCDIKGDAKVSTSR